MRPPVRLLVAILAACVLVPLASCGFGTVAAVSASSNGSGDTPSQILLSAGSVTSTRASPASIAFTLTDPDASGAGRPADVALALEHPDFAPVPIRAPWIFDDIALTVPADLSARGTTSQGVVHEIYWDFAAQFAADPLLDGFETLPDTHVDGFRIRTSIAGSGDVDVLSFALGNDPPAVANVVVVNADPVEGIAGLVSVAFELRDSGGDPVDVLTEFGEAQADGGEPTAWFPATAQGAPLEDIETTGSTTPTVVQFLWDAVTDLQNARNDVFLRFTPSDGGFEDDVALEPGVPVTSASFLIDNNADPIVSIDQVSFQLDADLHRGIPIRVLVADLDADPLAVLFQYRSSNQSDFPELPDLDGPEMIEAVKDPAFRRLYQIATDFQPELRGTLSPVGDGARQVRLEDVGSSSTTISQRELVGRNLEILRASTSSALVQDEWGVGAATLVSPVACLPVETGTRALVLDSPGGADWRLRRIELATGAVESSTSGSGIPRDVQAVRGDSDTVLVLTGDGSAWDVLRVQLATGAATSVASSTSVSQTGRARAITSLGDGRAAMAIGNGALLLTLSETAPAATVLTDALEVAGGIVRDPTRLDSVLIAARNSTSPFGPGLGRIVRLDLATRRLEDLRFTDESNPQVNFTTPQPRGLAVDPESGHLLAVCDDQSGNGAAIVREYDLVGGTSRVVATVPSEEARLVSAGTAGLRLVPLPNLADIAAIGGIEQERRIREYDPGSELVGLGASSAPDFAPTLTADRVRTRAWRLRGLNPAMPSAGASRPEVFVWDTRDVAPGTAVAFRAIPVDAEVGLGGNSGGTIRTADPLSTAPAILGASGVRAVAAADANGDGREDLFEVTDQISGFGESLAGAIRCLLQRADGTFGAPDFVLGNTNTLRQPQAIRIADLDEDGQADLVVANGNPAVGAVPGNFVSIYLAGSGGLAAHGPAPDLVLGATANTNDPADVVVADLNRDGRLDIATANRAGNDVSVFLQTAELVFGDGGSPAAPSFRLGGPALTPFALAIAAGDVNGDGTVDLSVVSSTAGRLVLFPQLPGSPGTFGAPTSILAGSFPIDVEVADVDGDGRLDRIVAEQSSDVGEGGLQIYYQRDGGTTEVASLVADCGSGSDLALGVNAADVDRDGRIDLVMRRRDGISIFRRSEVLLPDTAAMFRELCIPTTSAFQGSVAKHESVVRDLDGDADVDILAGAESGLVLSKTRGGGEFRSTADFTNSAQGIGAEPRLAPGDLDGDGDLDLVLILEQPLLVTGYVQTVPGVFSPSIALALQGSPGTPTDIVMADLDGDRDGDRLQDIVLAQPTGGRIRALLQVSPGAFGLPTGGGSDTLAVSVPGAASAYYSTAVADLIDLPGADDDGLLDLVVASRDADQVFAFHQIGPLAFEALPSVTVSGIDGPIQVEIADLVDLAGTADDGLPDLAVASSLAGSVRIHAQSAPGQFTPVASATLASAAAGAGSGPASLVCVDLDRDGKLDVLTATPGADAIEVWLQGANGTFGGAGSVPSLVLGSPSLTPDVTCVAAADVDADGDLDVVAAAASEGSFVVFRQTTPGRFRSSDQPAPALAGSGGVGPRSLLALDLDADGDADVARAIVGLNQLRLWFGGR